MAKLFLSYRRADTAQVTGRIFDTLVATYGQGSVFKDVDSIPFGTDFRRTIDEAVACCDVMLAVIGKTWLTAANEEGRPRLEDPSDYVCAEIESALARGIRPIPLLIEDAAMPKAEELPERLRPLAFRNAAVVRADPDFHRDMQRVIQAIGLPAPGSAGAPPEKTRESLNLHPAIEPGYQIRVESGPVAGRVFALGRTQVTVGRSSHCDIHLAGEPYCSRTHCALEWDGERQAFILNAWHTAGVILNGVRVHGRVQLAAGDRVAIGTTDMIFERA